MKYGILSLIAALLLSTHAVSNGGWHLVCLWPAVSCAFVALAYLRLGPAVFGKQPNGRLSSLNVALLLPYLALQWAVWHLVRALRREPSHNQLTEDVMIGRRLLSAESPTNIESVVDLTCEFTEPSALRSKAYYLFPILDGVAPSVEQLVRWVEEMNAARRPLFIHCAEGRGRTGLVAAAFLLFNGQASSAAEAVGMVQSKRPLVRIGKQQFRVLEAAAEQLTGGSGQNHEAATGSRS